MPIDPFLRDVERDEKGRFQSKGKQLDALKLKALELNKAYEAQAKVIARLEKMRVKAPQLDAKLAKGMKLQVNLLKQQTKGAAQALKSYEKMQKQTLRLQDRMNKQAMKLQKQALKMRAPQRGARETSGGGFFSGGIGFNLPTFLSGAAIVATTKELAGYVTELGRARDMAQALGGSFRDVNRYLPHKRDAELFARFAEQNLANRFATGTEIQGLTKLRDALQQALGPEAARSLTLDITKAFGVDTEALRKFLTMASVDVPKALAAFESKGVTDFATALAAVTQQASPLSQTANTIETAIQKVQDAFERFVTEFVGQNGQDIDAMIDKTAQGVVDLINWGRQLAADWGPVFQYMTEGFRQVGKAVDFWSGNATKRQEEAYRHTFQGEAYGKLVNQALDYAERQKAAGNLAEYDRALKAAQSMQKKAQAEFRAANEALNGPTFEPLVLKTAPKVEKASRDVADAMQQAANATKKEREEIEKSITPAEKAALSLQKLGREAEFLSLETAAKMAKLDFLEATPLGFASGWSARLDAIDAVNAQLQITQEQLETIRSLENASDEEKKRALQLEAQSYQLMKQRAELQRQLNRGYLDAVTAQAFGAGRFEQILLTQDKGLLRGLQKGIFKKNPLLGKAGMDAMTSPKVEPFRFSGDLAVDTESMQRHGAQMQRWFAGDVVSQGERDIVEQIRQTNETLQRMATFGNQKQAEVSVSNEVANPVQGSRPRGKGAAGRVLSNTNNAAHWAREAASNLIRLADSLPEQDAGIIRPVRELTGVVAN